MKVAALQLCASDDPVANLDLTISMVQRAAEAGAQFIATPEVTNCVSSSRRRQNEVLALQEDDQTLAAMCAAAARFGVWISVGSLALKLPDDDRFTNRSFMIDPSGRIVSQHDSNHRVGWYKFECSSHPILFKPFRRFLSLLPVQERKYPVPLPIEAFLQQHSAWRPRSSHRQSRRCFVPLFTAPYRGSFQKHFLELKNAHFD